MDCGVLYIAVGSDFVEEAIHSAHSIQEHMGDIEVAIATDSTDYDLEIFDHTVQLDDPKQLNTHDRTWLYDTTIGPELSPFDRTLYLDTDTYLCADVSELFELLDEYDLAVARKPEQTPVEGLSEPWGEFNTGVIAYRDSKATREFLRNWKETFHRRVDEQYQPADQPSFALALKNSRLRWFTLPRRYNVRLPRKGTLARDAKIIHGRGYDPREAARRLNAAEGLRVFREKSWTSTPAVRKHPVFRVEDLIYHIGSPVSRFLGILRNDGFRKAILRSMNFVSKNTFGEFHKINIQPYLIYQYVTLATPIGDVSLIVDNTIRQITTRADSEYGYEPGLVLALSDTIEPGSVFYDVGSRFGYYIKIASTLGLDKDQVHAFEADPTNFGYLKRNVGDIATINRVRVGDANSELELDKYADSHPTPDVVKIDVEGAEPNVLEGMTDLLETGVSLFIEYHPHKLSPKAADRVLAILNESGYTIQFIDHRYEGDEIQYLDDFRSHGTTLLYAHR